MDDTNVTSRRSMLKGLGAVAALAGTPALAAEVAKPVFVKVGSPSLMAGAVPAAIKKHRAAMREIWRLLRKSNKLESLPERPKTPKVLVGNLVSWDARGQRLKTPIMAYSHAEIAERCEAHMRPAVLNHTQRAAVHAKHRDYHLDLTRQIRARAKFDRQSGFTALQATLRDAYRREAEAEAVLLLAMSVTPKEAALKTAYIKRTSLLRDWTESEIAYRAVMAGLCSVHG